MRMSDCADQIGCDIANIGVYKQYFSSYTEKYRIFYFTLHFSLSELMFCQVLSHSFRVEVKYNPSNTVFCSGNR